MTGISHNPIGRRTLLGTAAFTAFGWVRARAAEAGTLTLGMAAAPSAIDPHYHLLATNMSVVSHIFETLVKQDAQQRPVPGLATGWRLVDETTWEFDLRPGVVFHDGSPFGADDVLFSLKRVPLVPRSPSSFAIFLRGIASAEAVGGDKVRFRTRGPYPTLPLDLSQVFILSAHAAAGPAPEGKTTAEINAGNGAVGTGPYRFQSFTPGDRVVLAANQRYWGGVEPWAKVVITALPTGPTRVAALLSGQADVIEKVPAEDLGTLRSDKRATLTLAPSNSITYLCFDQARAPSPGVTGTGDRNPLQDPRVRRALSLAINRDALAERILGGLASPAAELGTPGMFGTTPAAKPDPFDPAEAKRLLAEAGYPDGFTVNFGTTNGFYVQDVQLGQAVASFWTRVGVRTELEAVPSSVFYAKRNSKGFGAYMTSMSMITGQVSDTLQILAATPNPAKSLGQTNFGGYSNEKVDLLIEKASATMDAAAREQMLRDADHIVVDTDHGVLPIVAEKIGYGTRQGFVFSPRADKWMTAMQVRVAA